MLFEKCIECKSTKTFQHTLSYSIQKSNTHVYRHNTILISLSIFYAALKVKHRLNIFLETTYSDSEFIIVTFKKCQFTAKLVSFHLKVSDQAL